MGEVGFHVEVPVSWSEPYRELGSLQALRGLFKPILAPASTPGYALSEIVVADKHHVTLQMADDAVWSDGQRVTIRQVKLSIARYFSQRKNFCRLFGVCRKFTAVGNMLIIRSVLPNVLLQLLQDVSLAPRTPVMPHCVTTGAYRLRDDGALEARDFPGIQLRFVPIADWRRAVHAFCRGDIIATAPTAYEIGHYCSDHLQYRRCAPEVDAYVFVNSRRSTCAALASLPIRAAISRIVANSEKLRSIVAPEVMDWSRNKSRVLPSVSATATLLYADHWPNGIIAREMASAFEELGATVAVRRVTLDDLVRVAQFAAFDMLLILTPRAHGSRWSTVVTLGSIAAKSSSTSEWRVLTEAVNLLSEAATMDEQSVGLVDAICRVVPVIPVGRLLCGFLASSDISAVPLVAGNVFPIETLPYLV